MVDARDASERSERATGTERGAEAPREWRCRGARGAVLNETQYHERWRERRREPSEAKASRWWTPATRASAASEPPERSEAPKRRAS